MPNVSPSDGGSRPRRQLRPTTVLRSVRLSPSFQRVTLTGPALRDFALHSPGGHIKVFLPPEDADAGAEQRQVVRTYTPRSFDPDALELDVDVVLHGTGPGARWAARTVPGDLVGVAGPGRGYDPDPQASSFLLAGDETALAAVAAILAALPPSASARVLLEVPDRADMQPLPSPARTEVTCLVRDGQAPGAALENALRAAAAPSPGGRLWVAGEAAMIRRVRRHLLTDRGWDPIAVVTRGYWRRGTPNHPDHDYGEGSLP